MIKNLWLTIKGLGPTNHVVVTLGTVGLGTVLTAGGLVRVLTAHSTASACVVVVGLVLIAFSGSAGVLSANLTRERSKAILAKGHKKVMISYAKERHSIIQAAIKKASTFDNLLTLLKRLENVETDLPEELRMVDNPPVADQRQEQPVSDSRAATKAVSLEDDQSQPTSVIERLL